jgi:hypothetical protein
LIHINQKSNLITNKISFVIILLFPLFYIIGSAVLNFGVVILSLMFLASLNKNQLKILINDNLFKVFLIFFIYLILSNLMFTYNEYSLKKSIFYIKFLFKFK